MSAILMTILFYKALILQGEIWCWSLLGLKGLTCPNASKIVSAKCVYSYLDELPENLGKTTALEWKSPLPFDVRR